MLESCANPKTVYVYRKRGNFIITANDLKIKVFVCVKGIFIYIFDMIIYSFNFLFFFNYVKMDI